MIAPAPTPSIEILECPAEEINLAWCDLFDLFLCDPPYREHVHANATSAGTIGPDGETYYGEGYHRRDLGFGYLTPGLRRTLARQAARVKGWSLVYSDVESFNVWRHTLAAAGAEYIRPLPWVRWSQPQKSGDRPTTVCEMIGVYHVQDLTRRRGGPKPIRKRWNGPGNLGVAQTLWFEDPRPDVELTAWAGMAGPVVDAKCLRGADKHPTEKPLDLELELVSYFSPPGGAVLGPCAGAGTTATACALLGRSYLGCDVNPQHVARAVARAQEAVAGRLSDRDGDRVARYLDKVFAEQVPATPPKKKPDLRTWERARRRWTDAEAVRVRLGW